jgi:hypothetical protein
MRNELSKMEMRIEKRRGVMYVFYLEQDIDH